MDALTFLRADHESVLGMIESLERGRGTSETEIRDRMAAAKKKAPTRPHPKTPSGPGAQKTAGLAVAATDKLRDMAGGRKSDEPADPHTP
ncbi:hypothetical protein ACIBEK_30290 [Nocardia fusca]|uniref:hypothetical protein n=1 Tax=Nocardia fusca TaxID=941183 RepID=UPI0037902A59